MLKDRKRVGPGRVVEGLGTERALSETREMIDIYTIFSKSEVKRINSIKIGAEQGILDLIMRAGLLGFWVFGIGVGLLSSFF